MRRRHGVSPLAVGINAELAVTAQAVDRLRHKRGRTVNVAYCQLTGGGLNGIGFGQSSRFDAAYAGRVIGSRDTHCHHLAHAVRGGHSHTVCIGFTSHKLVVRRVHGVAPLTASVHIEHTVTVVTCHTTARHKSRCRTVDVRHGQLAACCLNSVGLCQGCSADTGNHRFVIGTVDGDCHDFCRTVSTDCSETVCVGLTSHEFIMRRVHGVSPFAACIQAELAEAVAASYCGLRNKSG